MNEQRYIVLKPDWKSWIWFWVAGVMLVPLFGVGLILLWVIWRTFSSLSYEIHERSILIHDKERSVRVPVEEIQRTSVARSWIESVSGLGAVHLETADGHYTLEGMTRPYRLSAMIQTAADRERSRLKGSDGPGKRPVDPIPESLERKDYLTGLWQQGLISDEDYRKELKHFE